jgi:rhodanese-related sulfurtransferase
MCHLQLKIIYKAAVLLTLLLSMQPAVAEEHLSPDEIEGANTIDAEMLIELAGKHDNLIIIDSRIHSDRRQGYIANSVSLPDTETNCSSLFRVIFRKNTPVVFYCNGPRCRRSDNAVKIASDCGYTDIYWFRGGFEEWLNKEYLITR